MNLKSATAHECCQKQKIHHTTQISSLPCCDNCGKFTSQTILPSNVQEIQKPTLLLAALVLPFVQPSVQAFKVSALKVLTYHSPPVYLSSMSFLC